MYDMKYFSHLKYLVNVIYLLTIFLEGGFVGLFLENRIRSNTSFEILRWRYVFLINLKVKNIDLYKALCTRTVFKICISTVRVH